MKSTIQEVQKKMKLMSNKIIILLILFIGIFNKLNAQCPAPSNLTITNGLTNTPDVILDWTENGTAGEWKIGVHSDYTIGQSPDDADHTVYMTADNHPIYIGGLNNSNCYVYYVKSICGTGNESQWIAAATSGCDPSITYYISTLANSKFSINENNTFKIYPNPSYDVIDIDLMNNPEKYTNIEVLDLLGKTVFQSNLNSQTINKIDISNINSGCYLVKLSNENQQEKIKLIKR